MANKSNHFYIDKDNIDFFKNSIILNAPRTETILKKENFLFLVAIGYYIGEKRPFLYSRAEGNDTFVMNQLSEDELAFLYAIAIADSEDPSIINDDIKVANIAMEYANAGIIELKKIEDNGIDGIDDLIFEAIDDL